MLLVWLTLANSLTNQSEFIILRILKNSQKNVSLFNLIIKYYFKSYRVYCLCDDDELDEGDVWEALSFASFNGLDNLVYIIDMNRLSQSEPIMLEHYLDVYQKRVEAFGWHTIIVDGHDVSELANAMNEAKVLKGKPTCILSKSFKGNF